MNLKHEPKTLITKPSTHTHIYNCTMKEFKDCSTNLIDLINRTLENYLVLHMIANNAQTQSYTTTVCRSAILL